jgi:putative flippase GtrA
MTLSSAGGRWLKFNLVGAAGIGVQLGILALLSAVFGVDYMVATALAVEAAVVHNFVWHERFTWADRNSGRRPERFARFLQFNMTTGAVSIGGNLLLMALLVERGHLPALVSNLVSIAVCSVANFVVSDRWVFRDRLSRLGLRQPDLPIQETRYSRPLCGSLSKAR